MSVRYCALLCVATAACSGDPGVPSGWTDASNGPCSGQATGTYCGDRLGLDRDARYSCDGRPSAWLIERCAQGCNDADCRCYQADCTGQKKGLYCGSDEVHGNPGLLYQCVSGAAVSFSPCPQGCTTNPPGINDVCGAPSSTGAPRDVRAAPGNAFAEVRWSGVAGATGYTVTASPGGTMIQVPAPATSARINGLVNGTSYSFTVQSGSGPASLPSNVVTPSPEANVIADVAFHRQERPLTCEEASLRMALEHQGIVKAEETILNDIGVDARAWSVDAGTLHWGDPYTSFVGDPGGSEAALTGYGTYYPNIARVAKGYGATVMSAGEGIAPTMLYAAVLAGHPAVAWVAYDWIDHPALMLWVAFDRRQLWWHGPVEHAVVLVGVTATAVLINNPLNGTDWQWVQKRDFENGYATFNEMAVILE